MFPPPCRTRPHLSKLIATGLAALSLGMLASGSAHAQAVANCSSDGRTAPRWLVERFMSADCTACWGETTLPRPPRGAATLDWVVPSPTGEDAPMAAVARPEALERLQALGHNGDDLREWEHRSAEASRGHRPRLRVAHGLAVGDHIGASLAFHAPAPSAQGPFTAWLALAEWLPAGAEGSPVARVLVRNVLTAPIDAQPAQKWPQLWRPMNVPEGAQPARLGVVGWVTDARGQVIALAQARCAAKP